jgi:hypothetical protein
MVGLKYFEVSFVKTPRVRKKSLTPLPRSPMDNPPLLRERGKSSMLVDLQPYFKMIPFY